MNHYKRNNGALVGALGVVVAVTMTAAIGLVVASEPPAVRVPYTSFQSDDSPAHCSTSCASPAAVLDEPELMRTDRANEHHG